MTYIWITKYVTMKKGLLSIAACIAIGALSFAQTTLYTEDFETGGASFSLNTADLGAATTYNTWLMNNAYTGGSGTVVCMGFPFSFTVPNTPSQPMAINNAPSSMYLHITAQTAIANGINCSSYIPADGTCVMAETNFSKMSTPISTVGYTNVGFDFWWMCGGSAEGYGQVYYSLDGGTTWVLKQSTMNNVTNWAQMVLTDAAWDNQASLQFAFRFVNNISGTAADPGFCVDQLKIEGTAGASNAITTATNLTPASWCAGAATTILVGFTSTGTFNGGNVYTAQLSDATGSFAAPTTIGTLTSTANSGSVTAIVPGGTPIGSGYRIRVVSDNPATVGSDNGVDLAMNTNPVVTQNPFSDLCVDAGIVTLTGASPSGGIYSGIGVQGMGTTFDPTALGQGTTTLTYTYTDGNGCSGSASEAITVNSLPVVTFDTLANVCHYELPFSLMGGSPSGGTYAGPGVTGGVFDPGTTGDGTFAITYSYTDGNGCSGSAIQDITVVICGGINEEAFAFQLFPNPTENTFELIVDAHANSIALQDMSGRTVKSFDPTASLFDVSEIPSGVYIVRLEVDGQFSQRRLVIR